MRKSEKNRGAVLTSLKLVFKGCDKNFSPLIHVPFINWKTLLAMKNMPDT